MNSRAAHYRGRFAPSPTGPLHLGSLIAALASFLDARHAGGAWLVRMEDLDPPREQPGAADAILHSLRAHGLHWDETVLYQSTRDAAYGAALSALSRCDRLFHCDCSRASLTAAGCCSGGCRERQAGIAAPSALRIAVPARFAASYTDLLQGPQHVELGTTTPDFVVRRRDGLFAYQLAVTVDDAEQHITHVVRGCDLLDSTPRQLFLQHCLGYATPRYCHLPVITTRQGRKFSKQNLAPALVAEEAARNLRLALRFLRQEEPPADATTVERILAHATARWSRQRIPSGAAIAAATLGIDA